MDCLEESDFDLGSCVGDTEPRSLLQGRDDVTPEEEVTWDSGVPTRQGTTLCKKDMIVGRERLMWYSQRKTVR